MRGIIDVVAKLVPAIKPQAAFFEELGPDSARTRTLLLGTRRSPGDESPGVSGTGVYSDEWRRTPEGWRFARRVIRMDV